MKSWLLFGLVLSFLSASCGIESGTCGDGKVDGDERCDGADTQGLTCQSLGFVGGTLGCTSACTLDAGKCLGYQTCGNGRRDVGEECDGSELGGETCQSQGFNGGGVLGCAPNCFLDTNECKRVGNPCGNGTIDPGEACDSLDLSGQTCEGRGFASGSLFCRSDCTYDTSGCVAVDLCGNESLDPGEVCDGALLNDQTCASQGFASGTLQCTSDCTFDLTGCTAVVLCGDGVIDPGEDCDGADLNGQSCESQGLGGGTLGCGPSCRFDLAGCSREVCGNDTIDAGEECDGANLNGETCETLGFGGGALSCDASCLFNDSRCTPLNCGNGEIDAGEECDGQNTNGKTCESEGFTGGPIRCSATCLLDVSKCTGGNTCTDDSYEPNSTAETAKTVPADFNVQNLVMCGSGDQDWFQVDLAPKSIYSFKATFLNDEGDIDAYLYDAADLNWALKSGTSSDDNEEFEYVAPAEGGSYLIKVKRYDDPIPRQIYGLEIRLTGTVQCVGNDECPQGQVCQANQCQTPAQGDTCANPTVVNALPFLAENVDITQFQANFQFDGGSCTGYSVSGRDAFYQVPVSAGQTIHVELTATYDAAVYLLSSCSESPAPADSCLAGADAAGSGGTEIVDYTATAAGTLIVGVDYYSSGPDSGTFSLSVTAQ